MHCAGCMAKVERALAAVPGVSSARVNLTAKQVRAEHAPQVEAADLIAALDAVGFASQPRSDELSKAPSAVKPLLAPLGVAAFACMNVMLLSVSVWSGAEGSTRSLFHWISALIGIPAIAYSGTPFFKSALAVLKRARTNMDVPISIGIVLATTLSFYETLTGGHDAYFDGVLMLILFLLAGRTLDAMMRDRARAGVDALLNQAAPGASVVSPDGALQWVAAADLAPGMVMRIAAGERLAADGEIVGGSSAFDQSLLTGESAPVAATIGATVHAGTLNLDAPVDVRVTAAGPDTSLAEIARLMDAAEQPRSVYVRIADRASRLYAPAVHTLAALSFAGWMIAGAGIYQSTVIAIAVLIITCPCALGLAVPVAQVVASGALMREGVMVKDGSAIERLATIDRVLLDKTGSLTLGRPEPDPAVLDRLGGDAASVALGLASHSRHPHSRSIEAALLARGHRAVRVDGVAEAAGIGLSGLWNGRKVSLGRSDAADGMSTTLRIEGRDDLRIPMVDRLRPDAQAALARLKAMGLEVSLLSGDNAAAVAEVAREVGLFGQAAADPAAKRAAISALQAQGRKVLMVGDGLNDGPALAAADASIAPGSASDVGRQAADLVFLGDSLNALPRSVLAARRTMRVVKQNFALAIGYNVLAVPLAIAGYVNPMIAAAAMSGSSLVVVANSLRLVRATK
ncbi:MULTISPECIES: heavy metal translocating P-type ATPase [unclassified Novosphingobium]|uniref:heavy metal translocating P-type ATPase n=1 Tax=unclassified Novosphingobium TaxID=2644732 RepID=UPI0025FDBC36|nr:MULTISPECIES: heavy metal translocating P-type ATPase [unclassified Novosphingobium]HQV03824.1 heavy metal translocating P-type ATPase [Novosphingobium sp.]